MDFCNNLKKYQVKFNTLFKKIFAFSLQINASILVFVYLLVAIFVPSILLNYRKVAYVGHIGNMVLNDFDHKKKYQDLFFIKGSLGQLLINYRSLRIK